MDRRDDVHGGDAGPGAGEPRQDTPPARGTPDLSPLEQRVLDVAKDMMQQHYVLNTVDLQRRATREMKDATGQDVASAIHTLLIKKVFFEGKAIIKENVLLHRTRRAILDMVRQDPGIHFSRLRDDLDLDSRSLMVHLAILLRHEFLRVERFDNKKAYYDFFSDKRLDAVHHLMHDEHVAAILHDIMNQDGQANVHQLKDERCSSLSDGAFTRRVARLIDHGVLVMVDASTVAIARDLVDLLPRP